MTRPRSTPTDQTTCTHTILQAQAGDADAWSRLSARYGPLLRYWCGRSGVSPQDVDDVAQDVFCVLAVRIRDFVADGRGSFRGWLRRITRFKVGDYLQRHQRERGDDQG